MSDYIYEKVSMSSEMKKKLVSMLPNIPGLIKQKPGKGGGSYIKAETVIDVMNDVFGPLGWSHTIQKEWVEDRVPNVNPDGTTTYFKPVAHVHINVVVKAYNKETKKIEDVASHDGLGAQEINGGIIADMYKGAESDAIKRACRNFGVGLQLWRDQAGAQLFSTIATAALWDKEAEKRYEKELSFLSEASKQYGESYLMDCLNAFQPGASRLTDIVPERVPSFAGFVQQGINATKGAQQSA